MVACGAGKRRKATHVFRVLLETPDALLAPGFGWDHVLVQISHMVQSHSSRVQYGRGHRHDRHWHRRHTQQQQALCAVAMREAEVLKVVGLIHTMTENL